MPRLRVEFANSLRGLAAIAVVISHYLGVFWINRPAVSDLIKAPVPDFGMPIYVSVVQIFPAAQWGAFGVAIFFLVSGFVIPFSFQNATPINFMCARIIRIFPVYMAGFTISVVAIYYSSRISGVVFPYSLTDIAIHLFPGARDVLKVPNVDGIIWTLEIEMKFYVLCAFLYPLMRSKPINVLIVAAAIAVYIISAVKLFGLNPVPSGFVRSSLFSGLILIFMISGIVFNFVYIEKISFQTGTLFIAVILFIFSITWYTSVLAIPFSTLWAYMFAVIVFLCGFLFSARIKGSRFINFCADISYPLYVVHGAFGYVLLNNMLSSGMSRALALLLVTAIAVFVSWIIHIYIEKPAQKLSRSVGHRLSKRGS